MAEKDYKNLLSGFPIGTPTRENVENNWKFIDAIDFKPYIERYKNIDDLMLYIDQEYENLCKDNENFSCVFDWIAPDELVEYIYNKYNIKYYEKISIRYERD